MDPYTTYALVNGAATFARSLISSIGKKMLEKYQKEAILNQREQMLRNSKALYKLKLDQEKAAHAAMLRQQEESHRENIKIISLQTEQYTKWPLKIPPLCLRGTSPLLTADLRNKDAHMPLYFMLAPGSDPEINAMLPRIEEDMFSFLSLYYSDSSGARIVMLKNCWMNPLQHCNELVCRNIHSFVNDTPMLIAYPVKHMDMIQFGVAYWNITPPAIDDAGNLKNHYSFDSLLRIDKGKVQIADTLSLLVANFADLFGWSYYRFPPRLIEILVRRNKGADGSEIEDFYNSYVHNLKKLVDSGLVSLDEECDEVLAYCQAVDVPMMRHDAFGSLRLLTNQNLSLLPLLKDETQEKVWRYVDNYRIVTKSVDDATLDVLLSQWIQKYINTELEKRLDFTSKDIKDTVYTHIVEAKKQLITALSNSVKMRYVEAARKLSETLINRRKWIRLKLERGVIRGLKNTILPAMIMTIRGFLLKTFENRLFVLMQEIQREMPDSILGAEKLSQLIDEIKKGMMSEFTDKVTGVDIGKFVDRTTFIHIDQWVAKIAQEWIEYRWLQEDIVFTLEYLGKKKSYDQDEYLYECTKHSLQWALEEYVKRVLNEEEDSSSSYSSDSDSDGDSFFDTVVMSPSF